MTNYEKPLSRKSKRMGVERLSENRGAGAVRAALLFSGFYQSFRDLLILPGKEAQVGEAEGQQQVDHNCGPAQSVHLRYAAKLPEQREDETQGITRKIGG